MPLGSAFFVRKFNDLFVYDFFFYFLICALCLGGKRFVFSAFCFSFLVISCDGSADVFLHARSSDLVA
jgi:hypothetical protein